MSMANLSPREAAKRKQILAAARQMFLSRGYAGTSMDSITLEAGISKQTLYRYYDTKERLFADLLSEVIRELTEEEQSQPASLPVPENREQLYRILLTMADMISRKLNDPQYISILRIIFSEGPRFPELSETFLAAIPRSTGRMTDLLRSCKRSGLVKLDEKDAEMSMKMFIGPIVFQSVVYGLIGGESSPRLQPALSLEQLCRIYVDSIT